MNRYKSIFLLFFGMMFISPLFSGGNSPEKEKPPVKEPILKLDEPPVHLQPMTAALVHYLGKDAVPDFQYYLSSRIVLVRENYEVSGRNVEGALHLDDTYTRETIEINGNTKGEVLKVETNAAGKLILAACFGNDPNFSLPFIQTGEEGCFDLEIRNGTVIFGVERYRVLYADKLARLLINMESKGIIQSRPRTEPGRSPGDERDSYGKSWDNKLILPQPGTAPANRPSPEVLREASPEVSQDPSGEVLFQRQTDPLPVVEELAPSGPAVIDSPENSTAETVEIAVFIEDPAAYIPGPPGGKRYRVQVGAFVNPDNARRAVERLNAGGFNPACVQEGEYYRVIIAGVPEADIPGITGRLDSAGFDTPWIQAER